LPFSYLHGWSPDGSTLSYCASRDGEFDVYVIPAEGGEEKRLTFTPGLDDGPEYSPDGKRIYFCSVRAGHMDCYFMDTNGENVCRLTDNGRNNWFPHISPDGKTVAYISYGDEIAPGDHPADKWVELRLMTADGENDRLAVRLFGGQGTINVNSWMPDSRHLAFVRYEIS
jgi:Tol biopolymer transport system component